MSRNDTSEINQTHIDRPGNPAKRTTVAVKDVSKHYTARSKSGKVFLFREKFEVDALSRISLVAESGESIGILGLNGSGKSTLLRMIAGSEAPTSGEVYVSETPTLLGVSAAIQPNLTGRANIRLGLLAMGLTPLEAEKLEPDIINFADIGDAVDRPMNTYSSGMAARLKFGISTSIESDILLVDEALATGDAAFAVRAKDRMNAFLDNSGTVFLVSHGANVIREHCDRAIWLHEGKIIADGPVDRIAVDYARWSQKAAHGDADDAKKIFDSYTSTYKSPEIIIS